MEWCSLIYPWDFSDLCEMLHDLTEWIWLDSLFHTSFLQRMLHLDVYMSCLQLAAVIQVAYFPLLLHVHGFPSWVKNQTVHFFGVDDKWNFSSMQATFCLAGITHFLQSLSQNTILNMYCPSSICSLFWSIAKCIQTSPYWECMAQGWKLEKNSAFLSEKYRKDLLVHHYFCMSPTVPDILFCS